MALRFNVGTVFSRHESEREKNPRDLFEIFENNASKTKKSMQKINDHPRDPADPRVRLMSDLYVFVKWGTGAPFLNSGDVSDHLNKEFFKAGLLTGEIDAIKFVSLLRRLCTVAQTCGNVICELSPIR